jgi:hypothetical protein
MPWRRKGYDPLLETYAVVLILIAIATIAKALS